MWLNTKTSPTEESKRIEKAGRKLARVKVCLMALLARRGDVPAARFGDVPVYTRRSARSRACSRARCAPRAHTEFSLWVARGCVRRVRAVYVRRPVAVFYGVGSLARRSWRLTARSSLSGLGRRAFLSPPSSNVESHSDLEPQPRRWKAKVSTAVMFFFFSERSRKRSPQTRSETRRFQSQARAHVLGSRLLRETLSPKPKDT